MTTLYRLRDHAGNLLYVGIAGNPGRRFEQHAGDKPWWGDVTTVTLEHYTDRATALEAERRTILAERPIHNVIHNGRNGHITIERDRYYDTLEPGFAVGVGLREPVADLRYYAGEIQVIDRQGIRLTTFNWLIGAFTNFDVWFPWTNIVGITEIVTPDHNPHGWPDHVADDQRQHTRPRANHHAQNGQAET